LAAERKVEAGNRCKEKSKQRQVEAGNRCKEKSKRATAERKSKKRFEAVDR